MHHVESESTIGSKSSSASWRAVLTETLYKDGLSYTYTAVEKDDWINRELLPDGKENYSMV